MRAVHLVLSLPAVRGQTQAHVATPRRRAARLWLIALCLLGGSGPAQAREDLGFSSNNGAGKKAPYLSPDGSFAAQVPTFWQARDFATARVVEFRLPGPGDAWLQVRRLAIAGGTAPKQLLLRAREDRLAKLPHFRELMRRELAISGNPAAVLVGDFWYQGNVEYPRTVEEMFVVADKEAFEMHFECFSPMAEGYRGDLLQFYLSFVPHPAATPPPLKAPTAPDSDAYFDRLPF